jgi:hypothetical protein
MRIRGNISNINYLWLWIHERCTSDKPDELYCLFWFVSFKHKNPETKFPVAIYKFNQLVEGC